MSKTPNQVFVLDSHKKPLTPCLPCIARKLLNAGKAKVFRLYPFSIILNKSVDEQPQPIEIRIDPGSKTTGIALIQGTQVIWGAELTHRGQAIKARLETRRAIRRSRRNRKTRYRKPRFLNRTRPQGWLPPSLKHRVLTTITWVNRLCKLAPIKSIAFELVNFDIQKMQNPEISGVEYQQGELQGYEVREYLLEKWNRQCAYCGVANLPLQVEHITPRAKGGSSRISNLCLACEKCNFKKGTQNIKNFLKGKPQTFLRIMSQAQAPLKDAAAVNSTKSALLAALKATKIEQIYVGSASLTKFNRTKLGFSKAHWIDAACCGDVSQGLTLFINQPLLIKAMGWGSRQVVPTDKYGFPRTGYKPKQKVKGWNTGDIVSVIGGKHEGVKCKRIKTTRFKGNFDIRVSNTTVISVSRNQIKPVHRNDGYNYSFA
jgi:5-methylcytosine-specific restriction endonuclease McrA